MPTPAPDITLYGSIFSRTFTPRWMLAELDLPYRFEEIDIRRGDQKRADYLRLNPMGKVPALTDHGVLITETAAICLYLADRYGYGSLAPIIDDPARGPFCRWLVYSTAVLEPAIKMQDWNDPGLGRGVGWGTYETVLDVIEQALTPGPWLLGERFTAADVAFGSVFTVAMFQQRLPPRDSFVSYNERLLARPACARAQAENWPAEEIAKSAPRGPEPPS